jgi:hypothetical protein
MKRPRTNTPLQALVTLNDPVFVEAAKALPRRLMTEGGAAVEARAAHGFRLCLTRPPQPVELERQVSLYQQARERFADDRQAATAMATEPIGPVPAGMDKVAAWTVVGNVQLKLDEMLARR